MWTVAKCPQCRQFVTVPPGIAADARVRCPRCAREYPLGEVSIELPPTLSPVGAVEDATTPTTEASAQPMTADVDKVADNDEHSVDQRGLDEHNTAQSTVEVDPYAAEIEEHTFDPALFASFNIKEPERQEGDARPPLTPRAKRSGTKGGPLRHLVGTVVGGLMGLAIGYYLLNLVGGPQFDVLHVYLPLVPHTYKHWAAPPADNTHKPQADAD